VMIFNGFSYGYFWYCVFMMKNKPRRRSSLKRGGSMNKVAITSLLFFLLVGCNQEKVNVSTPNDEQVPVSGSIVVNDKEYEMRAGEYEWNGDDGARITKTDSYSPKEVAKEFDDLTLEKDTKVKILLKNNPKLTVYQLNQNNQKEKITIKNNRIEVSSNSGYYLYEVSGKWPHGKATYLFDVNVK